MECKKPIEAEWHTYALAVREITESSSTFSATNISSNTNEIKSYMNQL